MKTPAKPAKPVRLKPGDFVYRVAEDVEGDVWMVIPRRVRRASDRQIELEGPFPDLAGTRFKPHALKLSFFATPEDAARRFLQIQETQIANAQRKIASATKARTWVYATFPIVAAESCNAKS
jgi:hypothetical protein